MIIPRCVPLLYPSQKIPRWIMIKYLTFLVLIFHKKINVFKVTLCKFILRIYNLDLNTHCFNFTHQWFTMLILNETWNMYGIERHFEPELLKQDGISIRFSPKLYLCLKQVLNFCFNYFSFQLYTNTHHGKTIFYHNIVYILIQFIFYSWQKFAILWINIFS